MAKTQPEVFLQARKVLGEYLRAIREHRGLTQAQLAESVGIRQADVSNVETGATNYTVDTLMAYVRGVDCYFYLGSRDGQHLDAEHLDAEHLIAKMKDPI